MTVVARGPDSGGWRADPHTHWIMPTLGSFFLPTVLLDAFMECSPSVDFVLSNSCQYLPRHPGFGLVPPADSGSASPAAVWARHGARV